MQLKNAVMMMMIKSMIKNVVALMTMIKSTIKNVVAMMMMMIKKSMTNKFNAAVMAIMMSKSRSMSDKGMNIVMIQELYKTSWNYLELEHYHRGHW